MNLVWIGLNISALSGLFPVYFSGFNGKNWSIKKWTLRQNPRAFCLCFFKIFLCLHTLFTCLLKKLTKFTWLFSLSVSRNYFLRKMNWKECKWQKQPSRGVFRKRCSENKQQIYRRTAMPKCNFYADGWWNHRCLK